jgi:hypothetical protein
MVPSAGRGATLPRVTETEQTETIQASHANAGRAEALAALNAVCRCMYPATRAIAPCNV